MPAEYPIWKSGETPSTHAKARVMRWREVVNATVIQVEDARYRGSMPLSDVFELVSTEPFLLKEQERYQVYCAWFGVRPPTVLPRILVRRGSFRIITQYTGSVADDISVE